jgi:hypothetical protein
MAAIAKDLESQHDLKYVFETHFLQGPRGLAGGKASRRHSMTLLSFVLVLILLIVSVLSSTVSGYMP